LSKKITLIIDKFEFEAVIGLLESERHTPQKVEICAKVAVKYKKKSMVDYVKIYDTIKDVVQKGKFFTVEQALLNVSKEIGRLNPQIRWIKLKILKPSILKNAVVGGYIKKKFKNR
jgi:dihydroneopterin aldolase